MNEAVQVKRSTPYMFLVCAFAAAFGGVMAGSYLTFFLTERLLFTAAVMASIMAIARIIDLIIGIASGAIVQRFMSKLGQYRFWLLWGPLVVSIGTTALFICKPLPMQAKLVVVVVGYIFYGGGMSFIQISQNGSLAKVAGPDMEMRINISGKMIQGQRIGALATSMITMPLIVMIESNPNLDGYIIMQCIYTVISFVGQLSLFFAMRDYDKFIPDFNKAAEGTPQVSLVSSLVSMFVGTLKNAQIILIMLSDIARALGSLILATTGLYFYTYAVGNPNMMAVGLTFQSVLSIVCAMIAPSIVKRIGKRTAGIFGSLWGAAWYAISAIFTGTNPWLYIGFNAVAFVGLSLISAAGVNFYLDCAEYQLYRTGEDNRTFAMSMFGVAIKIQFVMLGYVTAWVLNMIGYDGVAQTVAHPELIVVYTAGVPAALCLLSGILFFIYRISEDKAREYAEANNQRRAAAASASSEEPAA